MNRTRLLNQIIFLNIICLLFLPAVSFGSSTLLADAGKDQSITTCDAVILDGTGSSDPAGPIVIWDWSLKYQGESSEIGRASGETPTVSGLTAGTYDITLTVTNYNGGTATDTMLLEISEGVLWDVNDDCRRGLAEVIFILQEMTGQ